MKKDSNTKNKKINLILIPILGYIGLYIITLIIALSFGGRPTIVSLMSNRFEDESLRLPSTGNLRFLYVVAAKEVEDCDRNPQEFYPSGYGEYGRGKVYAYDLYGIDTFGFPKRKVTNGLNCLNDSQKITKKDLIGEWYLNGLGTSSKPSSYTKSLPYRESKSYNAESSSFIINEDSTFQVNFGCTSISGKYTIESSSFVPTKVTSHNNCPNDNDEFRHQNLLNKSFQSELELSLTQKNIYFSSKLDDTQFVFSRKN